MNDLIPGTHVTGEVILDGENIYDKNMDVVLLRKKIGMVFQKPNLFPMTVYENIVIGPKRHGIKKKKELEKIMERCLKQVALWDELKDSLHKPAQSLASGEQQRICIARALAVEPDILLMDESCSALDPESTMKIEELMQDLQKKYTIIIVTHNMEQARRVSDWSMVFMVDDKKMGQVIEYNTTAQIFGNPKHQWTDDYISGRFG
jgi:phosphate transport system ATP-binding protein